jgi:hypothetical protein
MSTDPRKTGSGWIGVDFDGTLAHYDGKYHGEDHTGAPVEEMVKRVRRWLADGRDVRLFTARRPTAVLRRWMKEHLGQVLPITNQKDHHMQALYDDRAIQVKRNHGTTHPDHEEQVWQK